jgi:hypothetical protein
MDWVQGEKFKGIANGETIFYCHTHDISLFLKGMFSHAPYTLITHNSDHCVDIPAPSNVLRWYSQNVNIIDPKIESLPIGIENNEWSPEKQKIMLQTMQEKVHIRNFAYLNHSISTNKERKGIYTLFENKPWVTAVYGKNGKGFREYIQNVRNHLFTFCPEGNGIDTHRTWEVLYMGRIPIEKRNINNQFHIDLPICFVEDWEEVDLSFLSKELERIKSGKWNWQKLTFDYWKNKIVGYDRNNL